MFSYFERILFYFLLVPFLLLAQKQEKILKKSEVKYAKGQYKSAYSHNSSIIKNANSYNFNDNHTIRLYLNQAQYSEAMYKYDEMDLYLNKGLELAEKTKSDTSLHYIKALKKAAEVYYLAGNYARAEELLLKALALKPPLSIEKLLKYDLGQTYRGKLKLNEALTLNSTSQNYWLARTIPVSDTVETRKKKIAKLPRKEIKNRKMQYADFINMNASIYLSKGNYKSLDSALSNNKSWIENNINKRNLAYRNVLYMQAQGKEELGKTKEAIKLYEKANKFTKFNKIEKTGVKVQDKLAYLYFVSGNKRESIKSRIKLSRAADEYFGKNSLHFAKFKFQEVRELYSVGKYDKAEKKLNNIYKLKTKFPLDHKFTQTMAEMKMNLAIKKSNFEVAGDTLNNLLKIKSELLGPNSPAYHVELLKLANFQTKYSNQFQSAKKIQDYSFDQVVAPQLSIQNTDYTNYLQQKASTYDYIEKYDLAIKYLEEAQNNIKQFYGSSTIEYAEDLEKLASVLIKKGDYAKAEELIIQSLNILQLTKANENAASKSTVYLTVGKLYSTLGNYQEAEKALAKASKFSYKTRKTEKLAGIKSADEIAALYIKEGRYNEAEDLLNATLKIKETKLGANNRDIIPTLNLLGELNIIVGNYNSADKNIKKSLDLTAKIFTQNSLRYTEALTLLEKLYNELGDFDKAEQTDKQILEIQKAQLGNNHINVAVTLTHLALLKLYIKGEVAQAETMLNEALAIIKFNLGDKNPLYAEQLKYMACLYAETDRYDQALSAIEEANKIWIEKMGKTNVNTAELALLKGNILAKQGKYSLAQAKYMEARQAFANIFSEKHPSYVAATSKLARTYYINKDYNRSLKLLDEATATYLEFTKKYFPSLSFSEKSKYWNQIKDDFEFYNSLAFKIKDKNPSVLGNVYNNMLATKAILLSSSIKVKQRILNSKDLNLINKYNEWTSKKQYLIAVLSMSKELQSSSGVDPVAIEKEIIALEKDLSESSELFANNYEKKPILWKDVRKVLKDNEYAVEILRFRNFEKTFTDSILYAALIISKKSDKAPQLVYLRNGKDLEDRNLKYYKNAVINKLDEDFESYEAYWKPIKDVIPDNATIYISSEGVYNELNVESMMVDKDNYAIDKNLIIPINNTRDLVVKTKKTVKKQPDVAKAVFLGNPTFYAANTNVTTTTKNTDRAIGTSNVNKVTFGKISQLPGTENEVNQIVKLFESKNWEVNKYIGNRADEDTLKSILSPKILHIATHGYFDADQTAANAEQLSQTETDYAQNPLLRSGLLLRGAGDVLKNNNSLKINSEPGILTAYEAMDLNLDNTDLVVLSACETGKGDVQLGEGVFGLQRAIMIAGAHTLVMTLFKVDDEITKELMIEFYKEWLNTGELRKSFTNAKKMIKNKYKYPIYWSSFVMIGLE